MPTVCMQPYFHITAPPIIPLKENGKCSGRFFFCRRQGDPEGWCDTSPASRVAFRMKSSQDWVTLLILCYAALNRMKKGHFVTRATKLVFLPPCSSLLFSFQHLFSDLENLTGLSWWCHWEPVKELNWNAKSFGRISISWMRDLFQSQINVVLCWTFEFTRTTFNKVFLLEHQCF